MEKLELTKKYEKYSEYKDSGAEWIGSMPEDWSVDPLRLLASENTEKNDDGRCQKLLSLSYGKIVEKDINSNEGLLPESFNTYQIVNKGNIVFRLTDLQNDKRSLRVGYVDFNDPGIITSAYLALQIKKGLNSRFAYYLLHSYDLQKVYYGMGGGVRQTLDFSSFKYLPILFPDTEGQKIIVTYLDEKTSFIDQIIEKKQKQIELLREKRTAVINHAVTKGLDPKAELVDSGIDWIGKIPKGWETKMVKHVAEILPSNVDKLTVEGETAVRLCNYTDVYKNDQITSAMIEDLMIASATQKQIQKLTLRKGDVIITKDSETPDDIGIPAYVPEDLVGVVCGYHLAIIRPQKIRGGYLAKFFLTHSAKTQFFLSANGLTRYAIGIGDIGGAFLPVPPIDVQEKIAKYLDEKMKSFDMAVKHVEQSIALLQEFKSSLISHVVTGKVKI